MSDGIDRTPRAGALLRVDASMREDGSATRWAADKLVAALSDAATRVVRRDLAESPAPFVDAAWIAANFTPEEKRTAADRAALAGSDALVAELQAADTLVIAAPIYNFGVPAALKAWIDQVARARVTFRYTENGPVGLLTGKKAYLVVASGGTAIDSPIDFATPYLRHVLGFIGITDVEVVAVEKGDREAADAAIERIAARAA